GAEIDAHDAVDLDDMTKQRRREEGAGRGLEAVLDMRELVDEGGAVLDRPELRCNRCASDPREPHAKGAARALGLGKGPEERGVAFFGLPAGGVNRFIGSPSRAIKGGEERDIDHALPCLALDRAAKRAGAALPPALMVKPSKVEPVAVAPGGVIDPPAGIAHGRGNAMLFSVGNGIKGKAVRAFAKPGEEVGQRIGALVLTGVERTDRKTVPVAKTCERAGPFDPKRQPCSRLAGAPPGVDAPAGGIAMRR